MATLSIENSLEDSIFGVGVPVDNCLKMCDLQELIRSQVRRIGEYKLLIESQERNLAEPSKLKITYGKPTDVVFEGLAVPFK